MSATQAPSMMRSWQYTKTAGGLENNLKLEQKSCPNPTAQQHLIQVIGAALNPVDYKPAEAPLLGRFLVPKPATPGIDIVGRLVTPAQGSALRQGQLVFGMANSSPFAAGGLAEYVAVPDSCVVALPDGVPALDGATVGVAGLTAYQTIIPHVRKGDRLFLNGGSGGTGVFGIQIAKAAGCHVTTTCSTRNVEFCKGLGADEVIDYTKANVVDALANFEDKFDHVVDNIGTNKDLFWYCHKYTKPEAIYVVVGGHISISEIVFNVKALLLPTYLGGGKRKLTSFFAKPDVNELTQIGAWMKEGKVQTCIDSRFPFDQAPEAFRKLKTGRARGKVVVEVEKV